MSFEKVVRPAQTPEISPPVTVTKNRSRSNFQKIVRRFGEGKGSIKTMAGSYSITVNYYTIKKPRESSASGFTSFP